MYKKRKQLLDPLDDGCSVNLVYLNALAIKVTLHAIEFSVFTLIAITTGLGEVYSVL